MIRAILISNFSIYPSLVVQTVKNLLAIRETQVLSWVGKIPWRRKWQPTSVFSPSYYSPGGHKESDMIE